jgi:hypothetical protein
MDCKLTCRFVFLKVSGYIELNEELFSGVEGLIVPTEEAEKSSGGTEDSNESNDGLLRPFVACGVSSISDMPRYDLVLDWKDVKSSSVGRYDESMGPMP